MLSGETAAGMYPVEALKTMVRIAKRTEEDIDYGKRFRQAMRSYGKPDCNECNFPRNMYDGDGS